jgi:SAM-dependent methyltransferase
LNPLRWKAYLAVEYKAETGGAGNDDTPPEQLRNKIEVFQQYCPVNDFRHVFVPGCGAGTSVRMLKDAGYKPIGYTLGRDNAQLAKDKYGITVLEQDMHMPGFNDETFDAIFADNVCEHALSLHIMFIEFWRLLRVGGRFYLEVPDSEDPAMWMYQWHHQLFPASYWLKYAEGYGFKLVESRNDGHMLILEKLPASQHPTWGYFKYVYEALSKATNGP